MDLLFLGKAAAGLLAFAVLFHLWSPASKRREPPEPAGRWPIIGHLHLLGAKEPVMRTFGAMAERYGPVFTFWLGMQRAVVVNSWDAAKECLTTHDKALAGRPHFAAAELLGYNYAMFGFATYGPYWRQIRKIAILEVLSNHRLELQKHVPAAEVAAGVNSLYRQYVNNNREPIKVEMKEWFGDLTFNNAVMMIAGKRYFGTDVGRDEKEAREFRRSISQFFYLTGVFVASDAIPFLKWLDLQGHLRAMKKAAKNMDVVMERWLEEHRRKRVAGGRSVDSDFIDVLLSTVEDAKIESYDSDTVIKATALALILGGTDTTAVTLTWALSLALNHPHVLQKLQQELNTQVGHERNVEESDMKNLPYLQAMVKEVMRLYPAGPLSTPHEAMEDCQVAGFRIAAGTRVMFNLWKLQRDPNLWEEPEEFRPERFLTTHATVDVRGQHFECIPFGSGRRSCPGISFALQIMHLALARLLHGFDVKSPSGSAVDMTEGLGLTVPKATPLEVVLTPRLPSHLYA